MLPFLDKIASLKGMRPLAMRNELDDLLLSVFNAKERYNEKMVQGTPNRFTKQRTPQK